MPAGKFSRGEADYALKAIRRSQVDKPWEHKGTIAYGAKTYHLWAFPHREGYTAYQLTHTTTAPPTGGGHYCALEGLLSRFTGAVVNFDQVPNAKPSN